MKVYTAVFFGGKSVEHEISIISALQAIQSIDTDKYIPVPVYITKDNEMYSGPAMDKIEEYSNIPALLKKSFRVVFGVIDGEAHMWRIDKKKLFGQKQLRIDIALPVVHGVNVEDGTMQGFLEMLNLPYVGCDVLSSALGMNKYIAKQIYMAQGLPVLKGNQILSKEYYKDTDKALLKIESEFDYPIIVKPTNLGSSVGISIGRDRQSLMDALELAFTFTECVLIEPAITKLREINCSVLGDYCNPDSILTSECEEPINSDEILSYSDKYLSGGSKKTGSISNEGSKGMASLNRRLPADITDADKERIQNIAKSAFIALGCSGVARIDFIIDESNGEIYLNEINTIPGSLSYYLWEYSGISYTEMLNRLFSIALGRKRARSQLMYSFETNVLERSASGAKIKK